jgi:hypothetical protein
MRSTAVLARPATHGTPVPDNAHALAWIPPSRLAPDAGNAVLGNS